MTLEANDKMAPVVRRPRSKEKREEVLARNQGDRAGVQAFERGLGVIRAFSVAQRPLTLSEIATMTGQPRATTRRLLGSLLRLGYASTDGQTFQLLPAVLELGYAYLSSNQLWDRIQPYMNEVMIELNESSSVGVLELPDVVYVARAQAQRIVQTMAIGIGSKVPAAVSAMGRLLLAYEPRQKVEEYIAQWPLQMYTDKTIVTPSDFFAELDRARDQGWILVDEELELGLRSLAVPLRDRSGNVIAAMNVGAVAARASVDQMVSRFLPVLREAANKANHALSFG